MHFFRKHICNFQSSNPPHKIAKELARLVLLKKKTAELPSRMQ